MAANRDSTAKILEDEKTTQELQELQKTWHIVLDKEEETQLATLKEAFEIPVMQSTVELIKEHPEGLLQRLWAARDTAGSRVVQYYANELAQNLEAAEQYQRFMLAISLMDQKFGTLNTATPTMTTGDEERFTIDDALTSASPTPSDEGFVIDDTVTSTTPTPGSDNNNNNANIKPAAPSLWNPINAVGYMASGASSTASAAATGISSAFGFMFPRQRPVPTINTSAFTQDPLTDVTAIDDYLAPNNNNNNDKEAAELEKQLKLVQEKQREEELERKEKEELVKKEEQARKEREELVKKEEFERKAKEELVRKEEFERKEREEKARKQAEELRLKAPGGEILLLKEAASCRDEVARELTREQKIELFRAHGF